jgi:TonB family protein
MTMQVDGSIVIDPQGQVSEFTIDTPLLDKMRVALDRTVRTWRFEPVIVDGAPRTARAKMRVILSALAQGDNYQVKIDNVVFPGVSGTDNTAPPLPPLITAKSLQPPRYPPALVFAGVSGTVLLAVKVGADGQVAQVMAVQSALLDVKGDKSTLSKAVQMFEQSAIGVAKTWRFNVGSKEGPLSARDMTVTVPITYMVEGKKPVAPGTWRTEVRAPPRPIEWLQDEPDVQTIGVADVADGEVLPVGSALTLVTHVVGTIVM